VRLGAFFIINKEIEGNSSKWSIVEEFLKYPP
jgi:hypothetical protein